MRHRARSLPSRYQGVGVSGWLQSVRGRPSDRHARPHAHRQGKYSGRHCSGCSREPGDLRCQQAPGYARYPTARDGIPAVRRPERRQSTGLCRGSSVRQWRSAAATARTLPDPARSGSPSQCLPLRSERAEGSGTYARCPRTRRRTAYPSQPPQNSHR